MNLKILYQWTKEISRHLPSLNCWQVVNLALFSYGVILSGSSQQAQIARKVVCGERSASAERRLRRFIANENFSLERFFVGWTRWILGCMKTRGIYLLVDETKLRDRMAVMVVGVAFESRCIPLAWRCYKANSRKDYPPLGQ